MGHAHVTCLPCRFHPRFRLWGVRGDDGFRCLRGGSNQLQASRLQAPFRHPNIPQTIEQQNLVLLRLTWATTLQLAGLEPFELLHKLSRRKCLSAGSRFEGHYVLPGATAANLIKGSKVAQCRDAKNTLKGKKQKVKIFQICRVCPLKTLSCSPFRPQLVAVPEAARRLPNRATGMPLTL